MAAVQPPKKKRRWIRGLFLVILGIFAAGGSYAAAQFISLKNNVTVARQGAGSAALGITNDNKDKLDTSAFKQAGDGRFNIVIAGIGGANHPGGMLTDTIQVLSIDTINKKAGITSVPRDLYVSIPGSSKAKINTAYQTGEEANKDGGGAVLKQAVGNVLGITISNFVMIDFTGAKDIVNSLGGIDVDVPTAINDPYFPDDQTVGYAPFYISAGPHHMDGTTALRYSRSRETTSDFDRSFRQQLVISAMKKKALSLGVVTNPVKINSLISAVGQHMKTDLQADEILSAINIYKDIQSSDTTTQVLDTSAKLGLLSSTTDPYAGYISYPSLGQGKYDDIRAWFQKNNPDPLLAREHPTVTVANGGHATLAQLNALVARLNDYGYDATLGQTTAGTATKTQVYEAKKGKNPISHNYLGSFFGSTLQTGTPLSSGADFEILYVPATQK